MFIHELILRNILSFGGAAQRLEMRPLNVLIGPNGSGKSNLLEAIGLLRSSATKLTAPLRGPGSSSVRDWIWKGAPHESATLEAVLAGRPRSAPLRHRLVFAERGSRFELLDEAIEYAQPGAGHDSPFFFYRFQAGKPVLSVSEGGRRDLRQEDIPPDESILSLRRDPDQYPELAHLAEHYSKTRIYREWAFGRSAVFRVPQAADLPSDRLEEDFSNLGLFLNQLRSAPKTKRLIQDRLRDLYAGIDDFDVRINEGSVQTVLTEGDFVIPATRLSDGTLRYLCLLAILSHPTPPPLVCIEEPELGLHPDMLPRLADLLIEASERTQLVVTTHSDILIDALSELPESVVVVEKNEGQSSLRRLADDEEMHDWLKKYRLGQLWVQGQLGGKRW